MADQSPEDKQKKNKKRPSAREILSSIFEEKKAEEKKPHEDSALFRGTPQPPAPPAVEKPARVKEAFNLSKWTERVKSVEGIVRRLAQREKSKPTPVVLGEWADRLDMPVGLEIGTTAVRAVQLSRNGKGWNLVNCAVRPLEIKEGMMPEERAGYIGKLLREVFPRPMNHLTSVSSFQDHTTVARVLKLPQMPARELKEAVAWQLQEQYGMRSEDWYFDFLALPFQNKVEAGSEAREGSKDQTILISAVPKRDLKAHVAMLKAAGLAPVAVEVRPYPTWELLSEYEWPQNSAVLLIELGGQCSHVVVLAGGLPMFIHPLDFTGDMLTKVIQGVLQVNYEEAEQFKCAVGLSHAEQTSPAGESPSGQADERGYQAYLALKPFVDRMLSEVEQAFKYFSFKVSQSSVRAFSKILLSGKAALLKGLKEHLGKQFNVPVEDVDSLRELIIDEHIFDKQELQAEALGLATAVGLAERREKLS